MLGAIIGDMVGSVYEFDNIKTTDFPFFSPRSTYTDDSIMTVAVAEWLLTDNRHTHDALEEIMVKYAAAFPCPMGGYGGGFDQWLFRPERLVDYRTGEIAGRRVPYNSWGNGAAMRVSAVGWKFRTLEETEKVAALSASITHDHTEGIKGAQATASAIFLARTGKSKQEIKDYIEQRFGYDLSRHTDDIRRTYGWEDSCQGTVPPAIRAFLDSTDFESAVRIAVSLGGDSDTLACITGGIAEAYYQSIPDDILRQATSMLPAAFHQVLNVFKDASYYHQEPKESSVEFRPEKRVFTPGHISSLKANEVFVFGSNLDGLHGGGAAAAAVRYFGAIWGQGVGMQGQCYAIPTMHGGVDVIKPYVDEFISYAREHQDKFFYVTRIGCGIAGFKDEDIAPLFQDALDLPNVALPKEFIEVLLRGYNMVGEDTPIWNVEWYVELTPDIPMTEQQYENFSRGYYPDWECRYAPIKVADYHYIVSSGFWLKKIKFEKSSDGLYHLVESYTSTKEMGRNLLIDCLAYGYFRPGVISHEALIDYRQMHGAQSTIHVDGKPKVCPHCGAENLLEVIYGEPDGPVDENEYILGGCCICETSHNWECPQCQVRFMDESIW